MTDTTQTFEERPTRALLPVPRLRRPNTEQVTLVLLALLVAAVSLGPLLRLIWAALMPDGAFDTARLKDLLWSRRVLEAIWNTVYISLSATVLAVVVGTAAALLVGLTDMRFRTAFVFGFVLPLMIPPQVTALAWIQSFSPASPILGALGLSLEGGVRHPLYSAAGIILLLGLYNAPLVFLTVRASLRRLPGELIEAGRAAGGRPFRLLLEIVLPLLRAGIFAGAALAFVSSIGNFGIQAMLGIPARVHTMITLIYRRLNAYGPSALNDMALLAVVLAVLTIAGVALAGWLGSRGDQRVSGAARSVRLPLGRWRRPAQAAAWGYLVLTLALPLSALVGSSLVSGYGQALTLETLTFAHYRNALFEHGAIREAFVTSLGLTVAAVIVLMLVSVVLGYYLSWRRGRLARLLSLSSELTYALPGIVIGVAMILFFLRPLPLIDVSLYGTVWIILIAYMSNFLVLSLRPTLGGFAQLDRSCDEAAQVAGAGFLRRMASIVFPMVLPAAAAGGVIVFMTALNEIQASVLLVSSKAQTIGPMIIFLEEAGSSTLAAAVGCLMILAVLFLMLASSVFAKRLPAGILPWRD